MGNRGAKVRTPSVVKFENKAGFVDMATQVPRRRPKAPSVGRPIAVSQTAGSDGNGCGWEDLAEDVFVVHILPLLSGEDLAHIERVSRAFFHAVEGCEPLRIRKERHVLTREYPLAATELRFRETGAEVTYMPRGTWALHEGVSAVDGMKILQPSMNVTGLGAGLWAEGPPLPPIAAVALAHSPKDLQAGDTATPTHDFDEVAAALGPVMEPGLLPGPINHRNDWAVIRAWVIRYRLELQIGSFVDLEAPPGPDHHLANPWISTLEELKYSPDDQPLVIVLASSYDSPHWFERAAFWIGERNLFLPHAFVVLLVVYPSDETDDEESSTFSHANTADGAAENPDDEMDDMMAMLERRRQAVEAIATRNAAATRRSSRAMEGEANDEADDGGRRDTYPLPSTLRLSSSDAGSESDDDDLMVEINVDLEERVDEVIAFAKKHQQVGVMRAVGPEAPYARRRVLEEGKDSLRGVLARLSVRLLIDRLRREGY